jgi:glycosyltransferase involved in cell wall biosynthesis
LAAFSLESSCEINRTIVRKILIIAPHFPPSALPPSQRVRLLVKHAKSLGMEPVIITVKDECREEAHDPWMLKIAGDDYKVYFCECLKPEKTRKVGVGDLGIRMLPYLYHKVLEVARIEKPDFILYPVPPWFILTLAPLLKSKTNIPYGIDFIDPWLVEERPIHTWKQKINHLLAQTLEERACRKASVIFSVSEGINNNLKKRYASVATIPMHAIPYGAEENDFSSVKPISRTGENLTIRYIGAVWPDAYPVLKSLLAAFDAIRAQLDFRLEFYGTTYANPLFAEAQVDKLIESEALRTKVSELPARVPYKKAVQLTMESDLLLLFGGMQPYYAASKLFGLIASQKPFIAFLHSDSFPAKFLKEIGYSYLIEYSADILPDQKINELQQKIMELAGQLDTFEPVDLAHPAVMQHSGFGMTRTFIEEIKAVI